MVKAGGDDEMDLEESWFCGCEWGESVRDLAAAEEKMEEYVGPLGERESNEANLRCIYESMACSFDFKLGADFWSSFRDV